MANPKPTYSFPKGTSGNPGGRPKRSWTFQSLMEQAVEEVVQTKEGLSLPVKTLVAKRLVAMAINGDIQAMKEIFNRMDGLPKRSIELTNNTDLPQNSKSIETLKDTIIAVAEKIKNEQQPK